MAFGSGDVMGRTFANHRAVRVSPPRAIAADDSLNEITYRDLVQQMNKIAPGGKLNRKPSNEQQLEEQGEDELELPDYSANPFVNLSPGQKKQKYGFSTTKSRKNPLEEQDMNPDRTSLGRKQQMEQMQLKVVIEKLKQMQQEDLGSAGDSQHEEPR